MPPRKDGKDQWQEFFSKGDLPVKLSRWLRHKVRVLIAGQDWTVVSLVPIGSEDPTSIIAFKAAVDSVRGVLDLMFPHSSAEQQEGITDKIGIDEPTDAKMRGYMRVSNDRSLMSWTFWYPSIVDLVPEGTGNGRR
jgi:hypothetical protein